MTDRTASPGDDAVELASRYLDGDLSVDERAAAESDPEVMAWVERFGGIRAALLEPFEADADQRELAITTALAELDEAAPAAAAPPPGRDELAAARARRSARMGKWLGAAAAVAVLVVGGAVLAANRGGNGDDAADSEVLSAQSQVATSAAAADKLPESAARTMADAPTAAMESTTEGEARDSAAATTEAAGSDTDPAATDEDPSDGAGTGTTAGGAATTSAHPTAGQPSFDAPEDLQVLVDAEPVIAPQGTDPPCADEAIGELVAADVVYAGQPAAVYRDAQRHMLTAWALDSCVVLAEYTYAAG